jgi:hypothetical protein
LVYVVACAVLSLGIANVQRGQQIDELITAHLRQTPGGPGVVNGPRVEIYDPAENFYVHDMVQNDPFLRGPVVRAVSLGLDGNRKLMHVFRPDYVRTHIDVRGEVWEPRPH